jgi:site-specific DNA-methyltransferase (adenine-specific)/adenine-specific DNA-methyltransferase
VDSGNLIVQGDNLHALKALLPRYAGQVKCIYIDPPYNTGNEGWAYNDNVNSPEIKRWLGEVVGKEGETLDRHDRWLCMMYPRLLLLKQFLRDDGVIFVSIDDNEVAYLRLLMDEIFGSGNFVANIVWQKRTSPDARLNLGAAHDHILAYSKVSYNLQLNKIPLNQERSASYKNPDNDPRGVWASVDLTGQTGHATPNQFYEIVAPNGKKYSPPKGRCWALMESKLNSLLEDGRIWFGKDGNTRPRLKKFLSESEGGTVWTWWVNTEVGHNQEATKEINSLIGHSSFETPKPTRLINRILQLATDKDSIILDSFAGSGTTAHAVMNLNQQDGGNRKFILVEMDDNIAQTVTTERNKRVIEGYKNAKGQQIEGLGGGFQYCRLSKDPLFTATGEIDPQVKFPDLAKFVWLKATKTGYDGNNDNALLGIFKGEAIYLLYNGILGDRDPEKGNVLTPAIYKTLPPFKGRKIIFAAAREGGDSWLKREQIIFKQTPYSLKV